MNDDAIVSGRIRRLDEAWEGHLERWVGHDRETVWRMLTDPQQFVQWLAPGLIELRIHNGLPGAQTLRIGLAFPRDITPESDDRTVLLPADSAAWLV